MMSNPYVLGFDVGGTRLKIGAVNADGKLLKSSVIPSKVNEGPVFLLETIINCISEIKSSLEGVLIGIGLGLSGIVDPDKGVVVLPGKFKDLENFDLVSPIREKFNVYTRADNDGRLAAYAEKYFGLAKDDNWAVILTIGTGVGSGVILDGKILTNDRLQFGTQLGHIIMDKSNQQTCLTGNYGTGEVFCSANALTIQVRNALQRGIPSVLTDSYYSSPENVTFKAITDACREWDELCHRELKLWSKNLSVLVINAIYAYSPDKVILSGGATLAADLFLKDVEKWVNETCFRYPPKEKIKIMISEIQEYAGVVGAAAMVLKYLKLI